MEPLTLKHREGQYPHSVDGPSKTLRQTVGIAPYSRKMIMWRVCAPELASKQDPPSADGTDSFISEIDAVPKALRWRWVTR